MKFLVALTVVCAVAFAACSSSTTTSPTDNTFREVKVYNSGDHIVVPAPLGTSDSVLGMAFNEKFGDKDSLGARHRMYPYQISNVTDKTYEVRFTLLETESQLDANASILFASGGITRKAGMRYAVLSVRSINRVEALQPNGNRLYEAAFYASKVYYGWTVDYVFEGDSTQMNEHVAANFANILGGSGASAGVTNETKKHNLTFHAVTRGLSPKVSGEVVIAESDADIKSKFTTTGSNNQVIYVEYEATKTFSTPAVDTRAPKYSAGNFRLDSMEVSVAAVNANGESYDTGADPDPYVSIFINQDHYYTSDHLSSALVGIIAPGKALPINNGDVIQFDVWDYDSGSDDDFIGSMQLSAAQLSDYYIGEPIPLQASGQVRALKLYLTPIR